MSEVLTSSEWASAVRCLGLGGQPTSQVQFLDLIERGLPVSSLERVVNLVAPADTGLKFRIVPRPTFARRKAKRLNARESVRVTRLASVWAKAVRIWKSEDAAREFLYRKHPLLHGRRPIDLVLQNEIGAGVVQGILGRLEHGSAV